MGLLKHLLFWPVTGPAALIDFSMRQIQGVTHRELTDDERIKEDLVELQMRLEVGEIDDDEYVRGEAKIMERLREARRWRQRLGMEEEWAPLEFPTSGEAGIEVAGEPEPAADGDDGWGPDSSSSSEGGSSSS